MVYFAYRHELKLLLFYFRHIKIQSKYRIDFILQALYEREALQEALHELILFLIYMNIIHISHILICVSTPTLNVSPPHFEMIHLFT